MLYLTEIVGAAKSDACKTKLCELEQKGRVERIFLSTRDLARRRVRVITDKGTKCAIALSRDVRLFDDAVLFLSDARAVVVHLEPERWLTITPSDMAAALELGYTVGNLHWRVRFDNGRIRIPVEGEVEHYIARLQPLIAAGKVAWCSDV